MHHEKAVGICSLACLSPNLRDSPDAGPNRHPCHAVLKQLTVLEVTTVSRLSVMGLSGSDVPAIFFDVLRRASISFQALVLTFMIAFLGAC